MMNATGIEVIIRPTIDKLPAHEVSNTIDARIKVRRRRRRRRERLVISLANCIAREDE